MHWRKITVVGVGLLGGSLGLAIRQRRLAERVEGYVRRPESVGECEQLGVVDRATTDLAGAVSEADLVVLCTPIGRMEELCRAMAGVLKRGAIVTDVGSVKESVVRSLEPLVAKAGAHFVGSHPMAGSEKTGVPAARADLFEGAVCAITPTDQSLGQSVEAVETFWRSLGMETLRIPPALHDELVARCSHLPHVLAAELVNHILSPAHPAEQAKLCANGFRDTTRIASGSPEMWRDIASANRMNLARVLDAFMEDLGRIRLALEKGDEEVIGDFFEKAKRRRDEWCGGGRSPE
jgi:prephenate dehydrogenase